MNRVECCICLLAYLCAMMVRIFSIPFHQVSLLLFDGQSVWIFSLLIDRLQLQSFKRAAQAAQCLKFISTNIIHKLSSYKSFGSSEMRIFIHKRSENRKTKQQAAWMFPIYFIALAHTARIDKHAKKYRIRVILKHHPYKSNLMCKMDTLVKRLNAKCLNINSSTQANMGK